MNNKKSDNKKVKCCDYRAGIKCDPNTKDCDDPECVDDEKCGTRTCQDTPCGALDTSCVECSSSPWCKKHKPDICK